MAECLLLGNGDKSGDATATAADILSGKTAYAKGVKLTGTYGIKSYSFGDMVWYSARESSHEYTTYTATYTMPKNGTVYYSGFSSLLHHSENSSNTPIYCRIYKNNSLVDSRDIISSDTWITRGTMVNKSFAANKGDVIKIQLQAPGCDALACMFATCVC